MITFDKALFLQLKNSKTSK